MNKVRGAVAGAIALTLGFPVIRVSLDFSAILIRRHWPGAWFCGLILWYSLFLAVALSLVLAAYVAWYTARNPRTG